MNIFTVLIGLLPGAAWLFFFLQEDTHPEPKRVILYAFLAGGLITIPTLASQVVFEEFFKTRATLLITEFLSFDAKQVAVFWLFLALAILEEFFKFFAVFSTVRWSREFDEPIDAMIYMITAALGFATVENIAVLGNFIGDPIGSFWQDTIGTISLRFVGATLLHALTSGLIGYYWARGLIRNKTAVYLTFGLIFAIIIHTVFNLLIFQFETENLLYPSMFLILVAFFLFNDFEKLKQV